MKSGEPAAPSKGEWKGPRAFAWRCGLAASSPYLNEIPAGEEFRRGAKRVAFLAENLLMSGSVRWVSAGV
jgi:hypothetical protein